MALLWGDLLVPLLLRVADPPTPDEVDLRANRRIRVPPASPVP